MFHPHINIYFIQKRLLYSNILDQEDTFGVFIEFYLQFLLKSGNALSSWNAEESWEPKNCQSNQCKFESLSDGDYGHITHEVCEIKYNCTVTFQSIEEVCCGACKAHKVAMVLGCPMDVHTHLMLRAKLACSELRTSVRHPSMWPTFLEDG